MVFNGTNVTAVDTTTNPLLKSLGRVHVGAEVEAEEEATEDDFSAGVGKVDWERILENIETDADCDFKPLTFAACARDSKEVDTEDEEILAEVNDSLNLPAFVSSDRAQTSPTALPKRADTPAPKDKDPLSILLPGFWADLANDRL